MDERFLKDYKVLTGEDWTLAKGVLRLLRHRRLRFAFYGRMAARGGGRLTELLRHHHEEKYGLEIKFNNIGGGLLLFHPFNITISTSAILGENVSIYKGVTIGSVRSGKRKGYPKIGNKVVICSNANVLGGITIGDDVLIAGGAFVDFDVPDHSVVIGNPGIIHYKEDCTKDYLCGK